MAGEALHEAGVAIGAIMLAARIGVDDVRIDLRFREDGFGGDFSDNHA